MPILSTIILIPLITALIILFVPTKNTCQMKIISVLSSITLILANVVLLVRFDYLVSDFQFLESYQLIR